MDEFLYTTLQDISNKVTCVRCLRNTTQFGIEGWTCFDCNMREELEDRCNICSTSNFEQLISCKLCNGIICKECFGPTYCLKCEVENSTMEFLSDKQLTEIIEGMERTHQMIVKARRAYQADLNRKYSSPKQQVIQRKAIQPRIDGIFKHTKKRVFEKTRKY